MQNIVQTMSIAHPYVLQGGPQNMSDSNVVVTDNCLNPMQFLWSLIQTWTSEVEALLIILWYVTSVAVNKERW